MKPLALILTLAVCFQLNSFAQPDKGLADISDTLLQSMFVAPDTTIVSGFQNYAIQLFMDGTEVDESILKDESRSLIGVGLLSPEGFSKEAPMFNLFRMHYRDLREKNFHRSIYYGRGHESLDQFFITWNSEREHQILINAVDTFLYHDQLPIGNLAFEFARSHNQDEEDYIPFYQTSGMSTAIPTSSPTYIRQNGNYIILIRGKAEKHTYEDWENLHATPYFVDNLISIAVLLIDPSKGTYGDKFKGYQKVKN